MELYKEILIDKTKYKLSNCMSCLDYFEMAYNFTKTYYNDDFDRIANTDFNSITPEFFFLEYQWTVYTSGFNARIVSKLFPRLREIYAPLDLIFTGKGNNVNSLDIEVRALSVINNKRKVKSIIDFAFIGGEEIRKSSWEIYKNTKLNTPEKLQDLPFTGKITRNHLARNLGLLNFVKADLHLQRLADFWKFNSPDNMCETIQKKYNMPLGLIDLCLFYFASSVGSKLV
jgi:hypothetical protein